MKVYRGFHLTWLWNNICLYGNRSPPFCIKNPEHLKIIRAIRVGEGSPGPSIQVDSLTKIKQRLKVSITGMEEFCSFDGGKKPSRIIFPIIFTHYWKQARLSFGNTTAKASKGYSVWSVACRLDEQSTLGGCLWCAVWRLPLHAGQKSQSLLWCNHMIASFFVYIFIVVS